MPSELEETIRLLERALYELSQADSKITGKCKDGETARAYIGNVQSLISSAIAKLLKYVNGH